MLQRSKTPAMTPARQALKLLEMRDEVRAQLGDDYAASTEPFKPFVASALKRLGGPGRAAAHVVSLLESQQQCEQVKKFIMCAAMDLTVKEAA